MHTTSMLPEAVIRERLGLLEQGLQTLRDRGFDNLRAHDLAGADEPDELLIPVLNVHVQPDISAESPDGGRAALAVVEVSSSLGEESCGRRWQALAHWAEDHAGMFMIFVHSEDCERARAIAEHWHLPGDFVQPLQRH